MERLTDNQEVYCNKYDIENRCCRQKGYCSDMCECNRYSRLQEYEDTGLSPKEIESLKTENAELKERLGNVVELPEELISLKKAINLVDKEAFAILDMSIEEVYVSTVEFQEDRLWLNVSKSEQCETTDWSSSIDEVFFNKKLKQKRL